MTEIQKIYVLLPAYNEADSIGKLINEILLLNFSINIILIDDGSKDDTVQIVEDLKNNRILILKHEINKGLGQAVKTGFDYIIKNLNDFDIVITMDADGTHLPNTIYSLVEKINDNFDCCIASRFVNGGQEIGVPFYRKILSHTVGKFISILFNSKVRDFSCGFRAYKVSIIRKLFNYFGDKYIEQKGFACMSEIMLKLIKIKANITEAPLVLRYDLKKGKSKIRIMKTIISYLKMLIKIKFELNKDS